VNEENERDGKKWMSSIDRRERTVWINNEFSNKNAQSNLCAINILFQSFSSFKVIIILCGLEIYNFINNFTIFLIIYYYIIFFMGIKFQIILINIRILMRKIYNI